MKTLIIAKRLYEEAKLERTFYKTKKGDGFYIHPKDKAKAFVRRKGKRIGIFIANYIYKDFGLYETMKSYLMEVDDEFRNAFGKLKPCPCGKIPETLSISGEHCKWATVSPDCCGEWMIEFKSQYLWKNNPELMELAIKAWNEAPRKVYNKEQ